MITNEERKQVAARLRKIDHDNNIFLNCAMYQTLFNRDCRKGLCRDCRKSTADRIADLIEPEERTCRNVADNYYGMEFVCSECTRAVPEDEYDHEVDKYCPCCGAKVVE